MPQGREVQRLIDVLKASRQGLGELGWLYVETGKMSPNSRCIWVKNDDLTDEEADQVHERLRQTGWREGHYDEMVEDLVKWCDQQYPEADDALLVRAFEYYVVNDALLPSPDAVDPTREDIARDILAADRAFYDSLGPEDQNSKCRINGCDRHAVRLSVLCRVHHFEQIRKKTCPFSD